jgi:type VI secretion system secreted protein VgrG
MPADLNFRPPRVSHRPFIRGPQTAMVTDGPDEYGRSKVKFPWDQDDQSRWARVGQNWAYNQMGTQFLPRIGSEVVVEFLNGDPDQPLIVGMVYNGKNKLPFSVPANKTQSGIRGANWDAAGTADKSNELRFEDKSGSEEIFIHAQKDFKRVVVNDDTLTVEQGNRKLDTQTGNVTETIGQGNHSLKIDAGSSKVEAMQSITLKVGDNSVVIDQTGVKIKGIMVKIEGSATCNMKSPMTEVDGDGMLTLKGGVTMIN